MKGVVFDFGGVMTTTTMPERVHKVTDELGIPWQVIEEGFAKYRRLLDGGYYDLQALYDLIFAGANIEIAPEELARIVEEDTASYLYRNERTLKWMKELKAKGYKLGILTNMPPAFAVKFREHFADFIALADAMVISGEERMFKPQRRIYELLRKRIELPAEELVFIDDVESNCRAAREAGWQAIRFISNDQVENDIISYV